MLSRILNKKPHTRLPRVNQKRVCRGLCQFEFPRGQNLLDLHGSPGVMISKSGRRHLSLFRFCCRSVCTFGQSLPVSLPFNLPFVPVMQGSVVDFASILLAVFLAVSSACVLEHETEPEKVSSPRNEQRKQKRKSGTRASFARSRLSVSGSVCGCGPSWLSASAPVSILAQRWLPVSGRNQNGT